MRIKITIPDELYAAIKAKAVANCRTLSQEICYVLSGTQGDRVTHWWAKVGQSVPQGDSIVQEETETISPQGDTEGQCGTVVPQSDPEGDTVAHIDPQEETFDVSYMPQYDAYNFVTDACNIVPLDALEELGIKPIEYPSIDWDAVVKKAELQSKAVHDQLGNTIGYLINGQIVKEEDL